MFESNTRPGSGLPFASWTLLTVLATSIGLLSLRYAFPHVPFPSPLSNFLHRRNWLIAHAIFASTALIAGPWQFAPKLRKLWPRTHRWTGRVYCAAVVTAWIASLPIAAHAQTGAFASAGFLALGGFWIVTTAAGYFTIRAGKVRQHREWMIVSYALTASAITLRIYLPVFLALHIPFSKGYPADAWACWVPNLIFGAWLVRWTRAPARAQNALQAVDYRGKSGT
ncbi:MAG: DUF2306 domain-containing protein [Acidobacteriota bacterium]|nr:DUF2306 domain-containing protein [Acidobacteriota bacterium]